MSFLQKKLYAKKDLLDAKNNVIIRKGEMGVCTSNLLPGEDDSKEEGLFSIVMSDYCAANPRWFTFEPYNSYEWEEYFTTERIAYGN